MLLYNQKYASPQRGLPVQEKETSATITSVSGETVQLYYFSGTTLTADAGQAAGTVVVAQLAYNNIKNALGSMQATKYDTSLSFTSTALTTEVAINFAEVEDNDTASAYTRATAITYNMSNGQYAVDYAKGLIYGKKADTSTSLTSAAYKVKSGSSSGSSTGTTDVNKWGGADTTLGQKVMASSVPVTIASDQSTLSTSGAVTSVVPGVGSTNLGKSEDASHSSGDVGVEMLAIRRDSPTSSTATAGNYAALNTDATGNLWSSLGTNLSFEDTTNNVGWVHKKAVAASDNSPSNDISAALEASTISKASAGRIYSISGRIDQSAATNSYYLQILNSATLPADGAVTILGVWKFAHINGTDTWIDIDLREFGIYGSAGLVTVLSTTEFTKTIVTGGNVALVTNIQYA